MRMVNNLHAKPAKMIESLRHLVESSAEMFADKVLYRYNEAETTKTYTYRELGENVSAIGTALMQLGLSGKNIAVIGENHPYYPTAYLATVTSNATIVPLDKELAQDQIAAFLSLAEVEAIFYAASFNGRIGEIVKDAPCVRYLFPFTPTEEEAEEAEEATDEE